MRRAPLRGGSAHGMPRFWGGRISCFGIASSQLKDAGLPSFLAPRMDCWVLWTAVWLPRGLPRIPMAMADRLHSRRMELTAYSDILRTVARHGRMASRAEGRLAEAGVAHRRECGLSWAPLALQSGYLSWWGSAFPMGSPAPAGAFTFGFMVPSYGRSSAMAPVFLDGHLGPGVTRTICDHTASGWPGWRAPSAFRSLGNGGSDDSDLAMNVFKKSDGRPRLKGFTELSAFIRGA